jgi:hypothetical protein
MTFQASASRKANVIRLRVRCYQRLSSRTGKGAFVYPCSIGRSVVWRYEHLWWAFMFICLQNCSLEVTQLLWNFGIGSIPDRSVYIQNDLRSTDLSVQLVARLCLHGYRTTGIEPYHISIRCTEPYLHSHKHLFIYRLVYNKHLLQLSVTVAVRSEAWVLVGWLLGSWVRIPLKASFCVVLSCVGRGLATGWSLVQGVLPYVWIAQETSYMWGSQGPSRTVEPREKKNVAINDIRMFSCTIFAMCLTNSSAVYLTTS